MDHVDAEAEAAYLTAPFNGEPVGARRLIDHHLGHGAIDVVPGLRTDGNQATVGGRRRILVRSKLTRERLRWVLCHELAEWHLENLGYTGTDVEEVAEAIAAALVMPRAAYARAARAKGFAFEQLAFDFTTTPTAAALRWGEVFGTPTLVVTPPAVRVRGEEWGWPPDEAACRRLARSSTTRPGVARATLGERRRVAMLAEQA